MSSKWEIPLWLISALFSHPLLGFPVGPFYRFFFGGVFPYYNRLQKKGYPYSDLSTGGPSKEIDR